jgi:hypothetical protein
MVMEMGMGMGMEMESKAFRVRTAWRELGCVDGYCRSESRCVGDRLAIWAFFFFSCQEGIKKEGERETISQMSVGFWLFERMQMYNVYPV